MTRPDDLLAPFHITDPKHLVLARGHEKASAKDSPPGKLSHSVSDSQSQRLALENTTSKSPPDVLVTQKPMERQGLVLLALGRRRRRGK
ncbi:uncharacterized protein PG986_011359 [Apiospora aurea]|uniref:Uncharacterized protein n=1 Tax=Apiospora aurea TaxID=335848 RepID=A0ABR1Q4U7_9PEZI